MRQGGAALANRVVVAGGGGSSFTAPGATNVSHTQGNRAGNGQVTISW